VPLVLDTPTGPAETGGETLTSTFMVVPPGVGGRLQRKQPLVRHSRNGAGIGMMERSMTPDHLA
jgi:hypothetical protein